MYRLIVVDDSRATQSIIRRALVGGGFSAEQVQTVSSATEALDLVATSQPHLVITDWHMPTMSGLELLMRLRQSGQAQIRVGMVTTETNEIRLSEARSLGVSFIVHKPFQDDELVRHVREALSDSLPADSALPPASLIQSTANSITGQSDWLVAPTQLAHFEQPDNRILLGIYSRKTDNASVGLGLMDANLVTILGGLAARVTVPDIQNALTTHTLPEPALPQSEQFLATLANAMESSHATVLTRSSLVSYKDKVNLLSKFIRQNRWGVAFSLTMPGLGTGSVGLINLGTRI
jgi:CheY-like chemotaxis protein